jgi:hypothetical protein
MKIYDVKSHLKLKFFKNMRFGLFCNTKGDRTIQFTVEGQVFYESDVIYTI